MQSKLLDANNFSCNKKSLSDISFTQRLYGNYEALDGGQISNVISF
jgi:hypothetical protein